MLPLADIVKQSVTRDDTEGYRPGSNAPPVLHIMWPNGGEAFISGPLPPEPPPYWSVIRDRVLRYTMQRGGLWADAVAIAATKQASLSFDVEGEEVPQLVKRCQNIMLSLDGTSYVKGVERGVQDFITTDNGEFWEIVRASNAAGSRVLGLMHLDSLRCTRTGDPDTPLLYMDLKGRYHELQDYEVIMLGDQPSPAAELYGVGKCAATRAYKAIYKMDNLAIYFNEKLTGQKQTSIHFINNVSTQTIQTALESGEAKRTQEGYVLYKGVLIIPVHTEAAVSGYEVPIAGVPEGWDIKTERDAAVLEFANAIGLDLQDLQPLSGQGLGTGAQSHVQAEKAKGKGLAARRKDFTHEVNEKVFPDKVTFFYKEVDLTDEEKESLISKTRADTRSVQIQNGEISNIEARALAVEQDDLPQEFKPETLTGLDDTLGDEEKPTEEVQQVVPQQEVQAPQTEQQPSRFASKELEKAKEWFDDNLIALGEYEEMTDEDIIDEYRSHKHKEHIDALYTLARSIDKAKKVST